MISQTPLWKLGFPSHPQQGAQETQRPQHHSQQHNNNQTHTNWRVELLPQQSEQHAA